MKSQRQRPCTERSAEDNSLGRENTLLPSWKNCIGCQWNSELITKPCRWLTNAYEGMAPEYLQELIPRYVHERPLLSSSQPRLLIPSAAEKHAKSSLVSKPFPTLLPRSGMLYHKQSGKKTRRRFANVWKHLFCEWLCTMCLFLFVYDFLSIPPPPHPLWAFKLMETSYKAWHHHHHQLKATK